MRLFGGTVVLLPLLVALVRPASAEAHANLVRSVPSDRAVVASAPRAARFVFDDPVRVASGIRAVRNGGQSVLAGRPHIVNSKTLIVPLKITSDGDYSVLWRVVSDDGHAEAGVVAFGVGKGRPRPTPSLSASARPSARAVVSRWLVLSGLLIAAGGAFFRIATGAGRSTLLLPPFVAVFLGASALLPHSETLSTRFGAAYVAVALIAALGATAAAISLVVPRAAVAAWGFALALLPLPSIAGHALDAGRPPFEIAVDVVHVAAAAVWTGGLVQLAFALRERRAQAHLLRRFSAVALVSVLVLAATGVVRAFGELRAVDQLWTTGYGRLLIVKTALLALLVALGWVNRYRLVPHERTVTLRATISVELVLLGGLVVAVAILTAARPGRDHIAVAVAAPVRPTLAPPRPPRADAVVDARKVGTRAVAIAVEPTRIRVTVVSPDGVGVDGLGVQITGRRARACGPGCYEARTRAPTRIAVEVAGRRLVFALPRTSASAARLVARATRVFRSLRSVTYVERLASSPTNAIETTFTLERPDRLAYTIRGGASAIVIGPRRWDRQRGGRWIESQTTPLPQPTPVWDGPVANAHLIGQNKRTIVVSFLNPSVPAWFHVDFDRVTLLPRSVRMTAPAHFMFHRYVAYNRARRVRSPSGAR